MGRERLPGPQEPIPPVLRSDQPGTWAFDTMSRRIREEILGRVYRENDFPPDTIARLRSLDHELANAAETPLSRLEDDGGPDVATWNSVILPKSLDRGETWLSAPWAVAEFYFYRRLMTAVNYFRSPVDPFASQKSLGLSTATTSIHALATSVNEVSGKNVDSLDFQRFVLTSLWGNRMDLSIWPVGSIGAGEENHQRRDDIMNVIEAGQKYLLSDDIVSLAKYVDSLPLASRFDIIADNAGFELFSDLCLADYLMTSKRAISVFIHLKGHPTFVSDAMAKDVADTIDFLGRPENPDDMLRLGSRWASYLESGQWTLMEDFFWAQPSPFWELPDVLVNELSKSSLVVVKGDANYRRLLGDCAWPLSTPFPEIACYFPAPICALRALKAEIGCGMTQEAIKAASGDDPDWLVSGRYGVLQFLNTRTQ